MRNAPAHRREYRFPAKADQHRSRGRLRLRAVRQFVEWILGAIGFELLSTPRTVIAVRVLLFAAPAEFPHPDAVALQLRFAENRMAGAKGSRPS
jgi:hypothetical protein